MRLQTAGGALFAAMSIIAAAAAPSGAISVASPRAVKLDARQLGLGDRRAGTYLGARTAKITNTGSKPITLERIRFRSGNVTDFVVGTDCFPHKGPSPLAPGASCSIKAIFTPRTTGVRMATLSITTSAPGPPLQLTVRGVGTTGYYIAGTNGGVASFGDAISHGNRGTKALNQAVIALTTTTTGAGYWLLAADGGIFTFGNARFFGSTGSMHLNKPVVSMAATHANDGYWLVASDGGIFTFGGARFFGSTGGIHLNQPIVGMAPTRTGHGYWLVARDGGIFTFGDAKFLGSAGGSARNQPIVGMAVTPSGLGYWLVARNGRVFTFGDARAHGADGSQTAGAVVGIAPTADGHGFWLLTSAGQVIRFGDARDFGDLYGRGISSARGIASTSPTIGPNRTMVVIKASSRAALNARMAALAARRATRATGK